MSRIGNNPIPLEPDIKVDIKGNKVRVDGPKGTLYHTIPEEIRVSVEESKLHVSRLSDRRSSRELHGLTRSLLANMITGVNRGFHKELEIRGVGYKAQLSGKKVIFNLGYSHPIEFPVPEGIEIVTSSPTQITVKGIDKQKVGQTAATIRGFRKPEPYKGKGIRYVNEIIRMKEGKSA